ncbi:hypothetical protein BD410DRAFT_792562 [Rickenella mellea]|uniref:Uncharacterized protein n=1 Tax=Rickenella mellea TaxID=50990 RepID=A0A4Y7PWJ0_9AGAM|nr:hypothetical protein BD410DRAFT_792562 [Rickenella mellea]
MMQQAPVSSSSESPVVLYYLDSGPVEGSKNYTTLICVHGHSYHSHTFKNLISHAAALNLRIVAPNRRDYAPSTIYTSEELSALNSNSSGLIAGHLRARGEEMVRFLAYVIRELCVPQVSDGGKAGGLALLGWSAGNMTTVAALAILSDIQESEDEEMRGTVEMVKSYLRTFIIYEMSYTSAGLPPPPPSTGGGYHPLADTSIPVRMRGLAFGLWVSSFYSHPDPSSKNLDGLELRTPTNPVHLATNETIGPDEVLASVDPAPGKRSEGAWYEESARGPLLEQLRKALRFGNADAGGVGEDVSVSVIYGQSTIWSIHWAIWELEKQLDAVKGQCRPVRIIPIPGANHFLHWEDPDLALRTFIDCIHRRT